MLKKTINGNSAILILDRPEKRNAINPEMVDKILSVLEEYQTDAAVRNIIITSEGKAFCAGADLEYLSALSTNSVIQNESDSLKIASLFTTLYEYPKPVIAAVNGPAIAGGCGLVSVCDFVIADETDAKFGYSEVRIGFIPAVVSIFLIRRIGEGKARRLMMSGEIISAAEALQFGLVDYISDDPLTKAMELAEKLDQNSASSMAMTKKMIREISNFEAQKAVEYCVRLNTISRTSEDFIKGLAVFLKK